MLERALAINEAAYGPEHTEVAITLTNLGNAYGALGDRKTKELLERALAIKEAAYGPEHTEVAIARPRQRVRRSGRSCEAEGAAGARAADQRSRQPPAWQRYGRGWRGLDAIGAARAGAHVGGHRLARERVRPLGDPAKQKELLERALARYGPEHRRRTLAGSVGAWATQAKELLTPLGQRAATGRASAHAASQPYTHPAKQKEPGRAWTIATRSHGGGHTLASLGRAAPWGQGVRSRRGRTGSTRGGQDEPASVHLGDPGSRRRWASSTEAAGPQAACYLQPRRSCCRAPAKRANFPAAPYPIVFAQHDENIMDSFLSALRPIHWIDAGLQRPRLRLRANLIRKSSRAQAARTIPQEDDEERR